MGSLMNRLVGVRYGEAGSRVELLQGELERLGYPVAIDGVYGPVTAWHVNRICIDAGVSTAGGDRVTRDAWYAIVGSERRGAPVPDPRPSDFRRTMNWALARSPRIAEMLKQTERGEQYLDVIRQLATLHFLRDAIWQEEQGVRATPAYIAEWLYARDIREEWGQNRGAWVDILVELAGGDHRQADPWCAWFGSACRRIAEHILFGGRAPDEPRVMTYVVSGRAAAMWQKALDADRTEWTDERAFPIRGGVIVRSRTSRHPRDRDTILAGHRMAGHAIVGLGWRAKGVALGCAGNSSGSGHDGGGPTSRAHARGRVALEVITADPSISRQGYEAHIRCVGVAHVSLAEDLS